MLFYSYDEIISRKNEEESAFVILKNRIISPLASIFFFPCYSEFYLNFKNDLEKQSFLTLKRHLDKYIGIFIR